MLADNCERFDELCVTIQKGEKTYSHHTTRRDGFGSEVKRQTMYVSTKVNYYHTTSGDPPAARTRCHLSAVPLQSAVVPRRTCGTFVARPSRKK